MKICFYQFFGIVDNHSCEDWGDCSICKQDEKNKECDGYIPITVKEFEVREVEKCASYATEMLTLR